MKVCMVTPDTNVRGGIASVVNGYRGYDFGSMCRITYVESYRDGSKWQKLQKALRGYVSFFKVINKSRPDIVHVHSSFGPSFYRKIPFIYMAVWKRIPVVNHIHGAEFDTFYTNASDKKKKLVKKVYNKCQMLIALSDEWRKNLEMIAPPERIAVIENYCVIPEIQNKENSRQILFLGEIGERKGCFDIPEIYDRAFNGAFRDGESAPLVIAGDGKVPELKELFAGKNLLDKVSFPGWVRGRDKDKLLGESGIFLFPSYNEGMPMAVLEAMAYGMAIITTDVGGIPRLIEDGVSGYICEPGNVEQLASRLRELLLDEAKRNAFGSAARRRAMENYGMESHIEKLISVYKRVLEG